MSKMGSHRPFGHLKHKLWSKERPGVKLTVWLLTIKSWKINPMFSHAGGVKISLESSRQGLQLCLDLIAIGGLHAKLCGPKVAGVPTVGISGLPLGSPETKSHLDVAPVERCRIYYKGECGGFPQVWAVVNLVSSRLLMARPSTKSASTMH
jgi:hypothetical protein